MGNHVGYILAATLLFRMTTAQADDRDADAFPRVELVTMGVGSLIWERHGHVALCVRRANPRHDRCYNHGVADFKDPVGMGLAFVRGQKSFWAAASSPDRMLSGYVRADRTVWVQRLPLTPAGKRRVIEQLRHDVKEENRYYAYDHFFDNCTTRVRDILDEAMDGALRTIDREVADETFRGFARKGFLGKRWALLTTDLLMGRVTDRVPTHYELLYLPSYMRHTFETEFGASPIVVYKRKGPPPPEDAPSGRLILALVILLLTMPAWATRMLGSYERTGMAFAVFLPSLLGLILWTIVVLSPVSYLRWNEAILIFLPTDAVLPFFRSAWVQFYARVRLFMLLAVTALLTVGVLVQPLWVFLLWPLVPCAIVARRPSIASGTS